MREVVVTNGANGALNVAINAFVNAGDELLVFEPCFPAYFDHLQLAGGTVKTVPLVVNEDKQFTFDPQALRSALSPQTKMLVLNTPHNPTGKCFTEAELLQITEVLQDFPDCIVLSDEVYEFLTFDGKEHISFAKLKDNWSRTITVFSGGKLLNATGWKIGWAIGPENIIKLTGIMNNAVCYMTNHPGQLAMAKALEAFDKRGLEGEGSLSFVEQSVRNFAEVRDYLVKEVREMSLPWEPLSCDSGYFLMVEVSKCRPLIPQMYFESHDYDMQDETPATEETKMQKNRLYMPVEGEGQKRRIPLDLAFARWMGRENGVTMMPNSFFYHAESPYISESYVRLSICKDLAAVKQVCERLRQIKV